MSNTAIVSRRIRKLEPRDKEYLHRLPVMGLYVAVRPDGSKHYCYRYTSPVTGKRRLYLMDISGADKYNQAVEEAADLKRKVKRERKDPLEEARQQQGQQVEEYAQGLADDQLTARAMCEWYIGSLYGGYSQAEREAMSKAQHSKMLETAKRSAYLIEKALVANVYPAIGDKRANTVTVKDCAAIHRVIANRGTLGPACSYFPAPGH